MKLNRWWTLLIGLAAGCAYSAFILLLTIRWSQTVSISYLFVLPLVMGAIPVLFSTKEQLKSYSNMIIVPWLGTVLFCALCIAVGLEGIICLVIIIGPFALLGTLGAFIARLISLKNSGDKTPLYCSLFLPLLVLGIESYIPAKNYYAEVSTPIIITADKSKIWQNIKNVKSISASEIETHFIHVIGIPKPLNGELDKEGVGGVRSITWEKGIRFKEIITKWDEGNGFEYDISVDPKSIPPQTLDDHVMIGGKYFDMINGSYKITHLAGKQYQLTLKCKYRITTNLNFYGQWWTNYILNDFNHMILEVIKKRCESDNTSNSLANTKKII